MKGVLLVCYTFSRTRTYMPDIPKRHLERNRVASRGFRRGKSSLSRNCTLYKYRDISSFISTCGIRPVSFPIFRLWALCVRQAKSRTPPKTQHDFLFFPGVRPSPCEPNRACPVQVICACRLILTRLAFEENAS